MRKHAQKESHKLHLVNYPDCRTNYDMETFRGDLCGFLESLVGWLGYIRQKCIGCADLGYCREQAQRCDERSKTRDLGILQIATYDEKRPVQSKPDTVSIIRRANARD